MIIIDHYKWFLSLAVDFIKNICYYFLFVLLFTFVGINFAGVKWVIRLQLVLLVILFIAVLDFAVGSFVHVDPGRSKEQNSN